MRRFLYLVTKKCRIYAACGVSQTPNNYISNHDITVGLFSALKYLEDIGYKIKGKKHRDVYYEVTKYLNVLGGTYILDYFTSEELEQKIIKYMVSIKGEICTE